MSKGHAPTITEQASQTTDPVVLLSLLKDASSTEAAYITGRLQSLESARVTDGMVQRIASMAKVGESTIITAVKRYDEGLVKASDGTAVVLSSDDRSDVTMATLRRGLGLSERTDRFTTGDGRSVAYTDLQRYWQMARASEDDIARGLTEAEAAGKAEQVSGVVAAIASATFRRQDPVKAAERASKAAEAKAKRETERAEAKAEAEAFVKVSADVSPITIDDGWSVDQLRAIVVQVNARLVTLREAAKAEAAKAAEVAKAEQVLGSQSLDTLRALLAKAEAEAGKAEVPAT